MRDRLAEVAGRQSRFRGANGFVVAAAAAGAALSPRGALARTSRIEGPRSLMTWAVWMSRSQIASASVGSPITSCQASTGS